jgi:TonB family protein
MRHGESFHQEQRHQIVTPKRFSLLISLILHFIGALLATVYIVQTQNIDEDAVPVNLMKIQETPPLKRRMPARVVKRVTLPQSSPVQTPRLQQPITTAVEIPTGDVRFTLPPSNLFNSGPPTLSDGDVGLRGDELGRNLLTGGHQAKIASVIPQIAPHRLFSTSIIDKIESTNIPPANLNPPSIEPPTVDLSDVTQPPRFLHQVAPKYPELARRAQKEGVVLLEATISVDGLAHDIKVIEGIGFGCDEVAVEALKASRFAPAKQGEKTVMVRIQIPYRFRLED